MTDLGVQLSSPRPFYLDVDCRYGDMYYRGVETDGLVVYGRSDGAKVNGKERPYFDKVNANAVMEAVTRAMNNNADPEPRPYYNHVLDSYVFPSYGDSFQGVLVEGVTYYPIFSPEWDWQDARPGRERELPSNKVLIIRAQQCPFCERKGTLEYSDPEYTVSAPTDITWGVHCEHPDCDTHFVVTYTTNSIQAYTDETLRFERGQKYQACPGRPNDWNKE